MRSPVNNTIPFERSEEDPAKAPAEAPGSPWRAAIHRAAPPRSAAARVRPSKCAVLMASIVCERLVLLISTGVMSLHSSATVFRVRPLYSGGAGLNTDP